MKALVRVAPKYRPISGDLIGLRIQAAVPNLAARRMVKTSKGFAATDEQVPAFRKPYLILESSDLSWITEGELEGFKKKLAWEGFTEFQMMTDLNGRKLDASDAKPATPAEAEKVAQMQRTINELVSKTMGVGEALF